MFRDPGSYSDHGVLSGWNTLNSFSLSGKTYVVLFSNIENGVKLPFGLVKTIISMNWCITSQLNLRDRI